MKRLFIYTALTLVILVGVLFILLNTLHLGAARTEKLLLPKGNIPTPETRTHDFNKTSPLQKEILNYWASQPLPDWHEEHKVSAPRIVLASFWQGKRLDEMNNYLINQKPDGISGSTWRFNPNGDYDFTLMALMPILFFFGDQPEVLYPDTRKHLLEVLLTKEGGNFNKDVPKTWGFYVEDTENHILMTQGSKYLKNLWLNQHGAEAKKYDNQQNGLAEKLAAYLEEMYHCGLWEFNSDPYSGYTISALLNLNAFGKGRVKELSGKILDRMNWQYALGSYNLKRYPPFRRQYERADKKTLNEDYHTLVMKMWMSRLNSANNSPNINTGQHHALWPAIMPYQPPDRVMDWVLQKPAAYYVKIGHGANACPEIYSGHTDYLISGGGTNRGESSLIVARPIVLFLNDSATQLEDVFHLAGPGDDFMQWNNTGVYKNFACAAGAVNIPEGYTPVVQKGNWQLFKINKNHYLTVYSSKKTGILSIDKAKNAGKLLEKVHALNNDETKLNRQFHKPNGKKIVYDLEAPADMWVIISINGEKMDRTFDNWPHIQGKINI